MRIALRNTKIRARLLVAYVGILLFGFAALTLVAGGQVSSAARQDFEQRLLNEIRLISQGVNPYAVSIASESLLEDTLDLDRLIAEFEAQSSGSLTFVRVNDFDMRFRMPFRVVMPEIETALRGSIAVVERDDDSGQRALFTAAPVGDLRRSGLLVQLSVPVTSLYNLIIERWAVLWAVFALVAGLAVLATLWVSRSIIQPLYVLRESARRLSTGDFSHRIRYERRDEIGEVAQAFNEMAQQVEGMLEEQRAFASNASHELRTPLTTIRLRSEALRYDDSLDALTSQRYIAEIDDEVARLGTLIEDLTLLSRFDAGRAELGSSEIDFGRFAASLQQQVQNQAGVKNIQVELALPQEALTVNASLSHLTVVFRNVLDNAVKYTPSDGRVTWRISAEADGVSSSIQDTGQGIDPEHLPRLFERFYRADKARSRDVPGSGLGLALVKSIAESYGGSVNVESEGRGKGTKVTIFWPYHPKQSTIA